MGATALLGLAFERIVDRAGLRPAPQADPHHHGRHDRRRADALRVLRPAADPAAAAGEPARLVHDRRGGDRKVSRRRGAGRPGGVPRHAADPQPHQDRPVDPRRRGEHRNGRGARLSHHAAVRRRVHGGLGARRPRRRDVGALPRAGERRDGRRTDGAGVHRGDHRRARLGHRLLHRRAAGRARDQLRRLSGAQARADHRHRADGRGAAVAPARALPGDQPMMPRCFRAIRRAAVCSALRWSLIVLGLALAPFLFPGAKPLNVAAKICIFIALAASYDLLLGYTGVVSFAHTMFYGIGSYGVAIALYSLGPRWDAIGLGLSSRCRSPHCWRWRSGCSRCGCRRSSSR